ncbi:MAG: TlpA disulfide reductase family protein [Archangium sp.]|nr:TlpA disulfide reductase family protein [Archangium sp.]
MATKDDETFKGLLIAAGIALVLSLVLFSLSLRQRGEGRGEGRPAVPNFDLERLQGGRVTLAGLRGKIVVVDFWATWCPPCRAEMPWLVAMGKKYESRGVVFVAISEDDPPGQIPLVTEFAREVPGLERFAVLGNPQIESEYGVTSLPTLFVVDRDGGLVKKFVGAADEATVVALIERLSED